MSRERLGELIAHLVARDERLDGFTHCAVWRAVSTLSRAMAVSVFWCCCFVIESFSCS